MLVKNSYSSEDDPSAALIKFADRMDANKRVRTCVSKVRGIEHVFGYR